MMDALNPRRYRVEHIFDLSEAVLRANFVLAHALVIHPPSFAPEVLRRVAAGPTANRLTTVVVSPTATDVAYAESLGARFVSDPFDVPTFKRAVYRAVSKTQERRQSADLPTGTRRRARVLLLHPDPPVGSVMVAVLQSQLATTVDLVRHARGALERVSPRLDCVVAGPTTFRASSDGAQLARRLAALGVPVVPLPGAHPQGGELDPARLAWDVAPQVRRSLAARAKMREAG